MNKTFIFLLLSIIVTLNASGYNNQLNNSLEKYKELKNETYLKSLNKKRNEMSHVRDTRDLIRKYQEMKLSKK